MTKLKERENFIEKLKILDKEGLEKNKKINKLIPHDREMSMIPITFDFFFKALFIKNQDYLKDFLIAMLDLDIEPEELNLRVLNCETQKDNYNEYKKIADIFLAINDSMLLSIELNRKDYRDVKVRNDRYIGKLVDSQITSENDYKTLYDKRIIQININAVKKDKHCCERVIVQYDKINDEIFCENPEIHLKNIENFRELYYNGDRTKKVIWNTFLSARGFVETYNILLEAYNEKKAQKLMKEVIALNSDNYVLHEWEDEKLNAYELYSATRRAKNEGIEQGVEKGIKKGIKQGIEKGMEKGIEQNKTEIIKTMLSKNMDINLISEITNTSIEKIETISKKI